MRRFYARAMTIILPLLLLPSYATSQESYIHLNKVIEKLEKGKVVAGIWSLSQNLPTARGIVEFNGFPNQKEAIEKPMIDFLVVAMEHYPYDITQLRTFMAGLISRREVIAKGSIQPNLACFVRIPSDGSEPVHALIKQVLDVGAHGVVVPHVRNAEEALKIVRACRYQRPAHASQKEPQGTRGFSPTICSYIWGVTIDEYYDRADVWPLNPLGDIMVIIMIEDPEGVKNIDDIIKVPGIGAIFFGPADYTVSSGNYGNRDFDVSIPLNVVKRACDKAGIPFVAFANEHDIEKKMQDNPTMFIIGSDTDLGGSASKVLDYLRRHFYKE